MFYAHGMSNVMYAVTATLPTSRLADEYVHWLCDGHVEQVLRGGAHSAMIVRLEPSPDQPAGSYRVMTQYIFPTRAAFDEYLREYAPALRADGLRRFGPERGVAMTRVVGTVV